MNIPAHRTAPVLFTELGVPSALAAVLQQKGMTTAFPVQAATLPDSLAGRDVCGKAPTGSGKTLAFGLALLARLPRFTGKAVRRPSALVLVPTRELASQIEEVLSPLAGAVGARVVSVYGGVGYAKQVSALKHGTDVLIACPGRLTDLVERRWADLSHVEIVAIDEADRMADMGFLPAVKRLLDATSAKRQTLLFSATLDGPVDKLVRDYQHDPVRHVIEVAEEDRGDVSHHFWRVEAQDRVSVTTEAVSAAGPAIVFCRTKRGADRLSDRLGKSGLTSAAIHGDRSQSQRERALAAFRAGRLDVLVATDVAARGIHVDDVPLVIHFDPPADATDYVHRSGRTARAGAEGTVVSLVGNAHLSTTRVIQRTLGLSSIVCDPDVSCIGSAGTARRPLATPASPGVPHAEAGPGRRPRPPHSRVVGASPGRKRRRPGATASSWQPHRPANRRAK